MTAEHSSYEDLAAQRRDSEQYRQGYAEARRAFLIGQAVRERRLALGLSQVELAARAGMTQPALSRLEADGVVPTIPLLERISAALDADLIVQIAPHAAGTAGSRAPGPSSVIGSVDFSRIRRGYHRRPAGGYCVAVEVASFSHARSRSP
jgi:transcriptional regulator with XRE-family HTH domain